LSKLGVQRYRDKQNQQEIAMQLSRFFTLAEMTRSDSAARAGIANQPDSATTDHLKALCVAILDPLREAIQGSISVNSGYRGPELNQLIRGARKSQHMEGKAADIQAPHISVLDLFKAVIRNQLPFDQVIYEAKNRTTKWVHVSHDSTRAARGQILIAEFGPDGRVSAYHPISGPDALNLSEPATRSLAPAELTYEETADEPEVDTPEEMVPALKRPAKARRKPAAKKAARKPALKRKVAGKRKAAPKRKVASKRKAAPKRKTSAKRARPKAKKHK
jgi:zinc D-Ala-D-Ala carboxypeptidase